MSTKLMAIALLCMPVLVAPAASAATNGGSEQGRDEIWAYAEAGGGISVPSSGGGKKSCGSWQPAAELPFVAEGATTFTVIDGVNHQLWFRSCPADGSGVTQWAWIPLARSPQDVATLAMSLVKRRLPAPVPQLAPAANQNITQVGTWFWTEPRTWRPVSATAYVPGLSATVTATPARLRFSPGDGIYGTGDATCTGPGKVWKPEFGDELASECMYTYRHSSSLSGTGTWPAALSIDWDVTFVASDGTRASLGRLTTTTRTAIRVGEIQAVITNG